MKYIGTYFGYLLVAVVILTSTFYYSPAVEAQSRSRSSGRDRESRALQRQIEALGSRIIENLPIPVLLGATLQNISPNFGDLRGGGTRQHEGHDTMAPHGTPVVSPTRAIVTRIGDGSSSGLFVNTANPGGESFVYMHLDEVADIGVGDELEVGDLIGFVGSTGNAVATAPHLHFEIRDGRTPLDPYPRLTREFTPEEKAEFLDKMIRDISSREAEDFVDFLLEKFSAEINRINASGGKFPREIQSRLSEGGAVFLSSPTSVGRDLNIGMTGEDVRTLQVFLIGKGYLSGDSATGYFGMLTEAAVKSYQQENNISPVSGHVGPLTRSALSRDMSNGGSASGMTEAEMRAKISELQKLLEELTLQLARQRGL